MFLAIDEQGKRVKARPEINGFCPSCKESLVTKCGDIVSWHFAHHHQPDCDPWYEGESAWHLRWKEQLPDEMTEVVIGKHRADIVSTDGSVIELQASFIPPAEIEEREAFYQNMKWVLDAS